MPKICLNVFTERYLLSEHYQEPKGIVKATKFLTGMESLEKNTLIPEPTCRKCD